MYQLEIARTTAQLSINTFIRRVYNWMAAGLVLTALTAYYTVNVPGLLSALRDNHLVFLGVVVAELVLVFLLAPRVHKLKAAAATGIFLLYAVLNGFTFSALLMLFSRESIAAAFFIAAGTFVACSFYSISTRQDLTSPGSFVTMGLIGIIIASVVNLFVGRHGIGSIINYTGVIIFGVLTAYDSGKLKEMAFSQPADRKSAVIGALMLYLDAIYLFFRLLYINGRSRE